MRRPEAITPASAVNAVTARPLDSSGPLPEWKPTPPPGGWTPRGVSDAALAYSKDEAADVDLPSRRIVASAIRALYVALPSEVKRAQIRERLSGVDHFAEALNADEPPPF